MQRIVLSLKLRPASANDNGQARALRLLGIVPLALGAILAWKSHWFYAD